MEKGDNFRSSELLGVLHQVSSAINNPPSNLYIDPSVLKEILELDKELSSVLNDLNLSQNEKSKQLLQRLASCSNGKLIVSSKSSKSLRIYSSRSTSRSPMKHKASKSSGGNNQSSSSISLYSTDSTVSRRSEGDQDRKQNLIIRCNYKAESQPVSKNLVQVFRHDSSCQMPTPLCPESCCEGNAVFRCRSRRKGEMRRRSGSRDRSRSSRKEEKREIKKEEKRREKLKQQREQDRIRKEKREEEKRQKERERKKKERYKQRKEKERERRELERNIKKRELEEEKEIRDRERAEDTEEKKRARKGREREEEKKRQGIGREWVNQEKCRRYIECEPDSEESAISRDSYDQGESQRTPTTCKTGIQCEIPCMCPRCVISFKSTQATNTKITTPPDSEDLTPHSSLPCGRSRLTRFLSNFGNDDLQLRLTPPKKTSKSSKSSTRSKVRSPRSITIDSHCVTPRVKCSRTPKPCQMQQPKFNQPSPQIKSTDPLQTKTTQPPPIKSKPRDLQLCDRPPICEHPCKLPRSTKSPSSPRLTPRVTPPCEFEQPCKIKPYPVTPSESSICTPPPCSPRPSGPLFPLKSKIASTRHSVSFEPKRRDIIPCTPQKPSASSTSRPGVPTVSASGPNTPRVCDLNIPPTCPSRPSTPVRSPLPGNFEPFKKPRNPSSSPQPCAPRPCAQVESFLRPCSSCGSSRCSTGPCSPRCSRPCTPTRCDPETRFNQPRGPCSTPHSNHQPLDPIQRVTPSNNSPYPAKPCLSNSFEPGESSSTCSRLYRQQPPDHGSQCNVGRWTCCTKEARPPEARSQRNPCSPRRSESDSCHRRCSCGARRSSLSPVCSREDVSYLGRKYKRPWWSPRSPSSNSLGGCSDCRRRCDHGKYRSPYGSEDQFGYPRMYPCPPWWSYYPLDDPYCSMESVCYPPRYRFSYPPKECVSIPCSAVPCGPISGSPPRKSLSCTPPSYETQCGPPYRHRYAAPYRCPPCPSPPCVPSPPYCPPRIPPPWQQRPLPVPPSPRPPCPSCSPTPGSSRTSCRPQPDGRTWGPTTPQPMTRDQAVGPICEPPLHRRPLFFKGPSCLKKFPKCSGKHGMKRLRFPQSCDVKPCNRTPSRPFIACGSPTPSYGNVRYPTPSSSFGSYYCPYPPTKLMYQPYDYWPNQLQDHGGYPPCYPNQTYSGPGHGSLLSKLRHSALKCSKLYHMSCESGLPKYNNSGTSSISSISSCSSSKSSLSSSESTYPSRSSSSSNSTSRTTPSYCIASCKNSKSNLFKPRRRLSHSSISSSSDSSPRCSICDVIGRCLPNRPSSGSPIARNTPPTMSRTDQQDPVCEPPVTTSRLPVHCTRSQVCSSATEVHYAPRERSKGVDHYDERIRFELKKIGMDQLIKASKPAKCCKQTVLNQPSREELPYAASLASLPLDRADIRVIKQSVRMASNKTDCNYTSLQDRTKLVYYVNLGLDEVETEKQKFSPEYEVRYFYFTLDDADNVDYSLRKSYNKSSMFKFFQIFNWSEKSPIQGLEVGSSAQKVHLATSLDLKNHITPTKTKNDLFTTSSVGKSTYALENVVISDLLLANQSGVGDSNVRNSLDEHFMNEFKRVGKKNHKLNMNFTMAETSQEADSLFEDVPNCEGFDFGSASPTKKCNASSQTDITQSSLQNPQISSSASQTNEPTRDVNLGNVTLSEEIMRLLSSSDGDSVENLKKKASFLVSTSVAILGVDNLRVHSKSNDEEFRIVTENLEEAIKEVLGEIKQLAMMAESFKGEILNSHESKSKSKEFIIERSTLSSKPPTETKESTTKEFMHGRPECNEIVQKECLPDTRDSYPTPISKGQFIVRMYNSINEVISEIYEEAEKLATLRKNRFALSKVGKEHFPKKHCHKKLMRFDLGKVSGDTDDELSKMPEKPKTNDQSYSLENSKRLYTSTGKIITNFYNSRGRAVKSIYNIEGQRITESSSTRKLAKMLFDDMGHFISGYCDSQGNILREVYDSQRKLLQKTFNSEMLLISFPSEDKKKKNKRIFNFQGFPVYQLYSDESKLLTSIYDFDGSLIRGTFLGNISQLCPRIFDKNGKFILGRCDGQGKMLKRIFDSHGNNLQQLYKADGTTLRKAPVRLRILDQNGEPLRKFFKKNKTPLTHVYDVLGNLLCQARDGNSKDLLYRLFDLEGIFILGRLDELRHLIEAVYDENGNKILQVRVLDLEIGDMIKISKLYNFKGNLLVNFYNEGKVCLKNVHDAKGTLIESSPSGRAVKLAGRMFDMAGYFIHGRYDDKNDLIREIYDHEGYRILRVYDVNGKPVRRLPNSNIIFNFKGKQIRHLYKSDHKIISGIYDANGDMIGGVLSIDAEELAPFLFDMEGKFINSRYDSQMNLIKHVYDSRNNILSRVYTQQSLGVKCSKFLRENPRPLKTVYVKLESKGKTCFHASCNNAQTTFDGHCQTVPKSILPPLTMSKITKKYSKFQVSTSRKRKRGEQCFEEGRHLVSGKCQCKMEGKKGNSEFSTSYAASKLTPQKFYNLGSKSPPIQRPAKRKKIERGARKGTKKPENLDKGRVENYHQNENNKTTTSLQRPKSGQTKVLTTIMPCYETNRSDTQRKGDSLESLLDGYLQQGQTSYRPRETEDKNMELTSHSNTRLQPADESSNRSDHSKQEPAESSTTSTFSNSSQGTASKEVSENATEDAFLCNIPNAPPFILRMNKVSPAPDLSISYPGEIEKSEICSSSPSFTSTEESFDVEDLSNFSSSLMEKKCSFYTEIPNVNMFIDGNCPGLEDEEFKKFVAKSITWIKTEDEERFRRPCGPFMSTPTICMAGLTSISSNPFGLEESDSRRPGKNNRSFLNADELYKKDSYHNYSKIPRMLHPGKCKVHSKMKNVQLPPGSKGCAANRASTCSGSCRSDKKEIQINPYVKVSVSTTCPSLTNASPSGNVEAGGKQENKNKNDNIETPQSSMGDCMKGIKSDPGCYCGNDSVEPTPCPIRLREDFECVEEEAATVVAEPEEEPLCYSPSGEQPLLMKKSNIECDCANRRRCEEQTLVEPPKEKPDVFWALTKVSLLKDGSKNFEIIDVSPVPPGYYLMPEVNNLVLVGPQPKPAKPAPSKNCSCK